MARPADPNRTWRGKPLEALTREELLEAYLEADDFRQRTIDRAMGADQANQAIVARKDIKGRNK